MKSACILMSIKVEIILMLNRDNVCILYREETDNVNAEEIIDDRIRTKRFA